MPARPHFVSGTEGSRWRRRTENVRYRSVFDKSCSSAHDAIADNLSIHHKKEMTRTQQLAFVEFVISDDAAFNRLATVAGQLRKQKNGDGIRDENFWLRLFTVSDLAEFWWPSEAERELWNEFWFSTPLPDRHSPEMPTPPWDFGSMIDAILDGEYELVGVRKLTQGRARFELDPHSYPYGGIDSVRTLVRAFGHSITGCDDGTGYRDGDVQGPRWSGVM